MRKDDLPESVFVRAGRKGGFARAARHPDSRKELAKRAAHKRWNGRKLTPPHPVEIDLPACKRKLAREVMDALARKNGEELMVELGGKAFNRAYNPDCPPKPRRVPSAVKS